MNRNIANEKQVKRAKADDKNTRFAELEDLRKVLKTKEGRNVIWRFISKCGAFKSVMTGSSQTFYNSGQQDLGHFIMTEVDLSDQEALFTMMRENKKQGEDINVRRNNRATK